MLRIVRFKVKGFQHPDRSVDILFSKSPVSIIYGENGSGKTTLLKILFAALNQQASALQEESVRSVEIEYIDEDGENKKVVIGLIDIEGVIDPENETSVDERYDWTQLQNSSLGNSSSLSIGIERGLSTQPIRIKPETIHRFLATRRSSAKDSRYYPAGRDVAYELAHYLNIQQRLSGANKKDGLDINEQHLFVKNIEIRNIESLLLERYRVARNIATEKIQSALFDTLASVINGQLGPVLSSKDQVTDISGDLVKNKNRIVEALVAGPENAFKNEVIQTLIKIKKQEDVAPLLENEILAKLMINMVGELKLEKQLLSSINHLIETFNKFLIGGKRLEIDDSQLKICVGKSEHSVDYLSSGERHILTFLALVVTAGRGRNFLIIDEPEISLNVKWQRILMEVILELVPSTQVIVATHSPVISNGNLESLVRLSPMEEESNE